MLCLCWPPGGTLAQITSALFPCLKTWDNTTTLYISFETVQVMEWVLQAYQILYTSTYDSFLFCFWNMCHAVCGVNVAFWSDVLQSHFGPNNTFVKHTYYPCHLVDLVYYSSTVKLGWPLINRWPLYAEGEVTSINQYFHLLNGRYKWSSLHAKCHAKYTQIKTRYPQDILETF